VFIVVGLRVAFLIRNSGMGGGASFIVAFVPALLAAGLFERASAKKRPAA
jgi:hypothetical protein